LGFIVMRKEEPSENSTRASRKRLFFLKRSPREGVLALEAVRDDSEAALGRNSGAARALDREGLEFLQGGAPWGSRHFEATVLHTPRGRAPPDLKPSVARNDGARYTGRRKL